MPLVILAQLELAAMQELEPLLVTPAIPVPQEILEQQVQMGLLALHQRYLESI